MRRTARAPRWFIITALIAAAIIVDAGVALAAHRARPVVQKMRPAATSEVSPDLGRAPLPDVPGPMRMPDTQLEPLTWADLHGWDSDDHALAFAMLRTSCRAVIGHARDDRPMAGALADVCRKAVASKPLSEADARAFYEQNFVPVRILKLGDSAGFLTGYYEPVFEGSRFPTQVFHTPVFRRPPDLIPPAGYVRGQGFPNTGRSMRRLPDGTLFPYYERGEIEDGALDGRHLEICWLKNPIDLLFMQIQGSGRVRLEDGTVVRLNYDGHNGWPYVAVGRALIENQVIPREEMSMDRIREWMEANPEGAKQIRRSNKSFVFFRVVGLSDDNEPAGAQGVPLTPGRSIAVDRALHVYGTPFFIEAELPIDAPRAKTPFRRTMLAQDTGSAIVGPARADIYYGAGEEAGHIAGRLRHPGQFAMLVPKSLDLAAAGAQMPLPTPRPKFEEPEKPVAATPAHGKTAGEAADVTKELPIPRPRPMSRQRYRRRA